jgi:response regulator of citrate/malate metabolism
MRTVKVHPENSINFTKDAKFWTEMTNVYKKFYPKHSFKQMAQHLGLSETNCRRYYYGVHHVNGQAVQWRKGYTQVRQGACVTL